MASETEPLDGLLNIQRKQWFHGLHANMRRHVMVANPSTFAACLELALNAEEAEGGMETAVILWEFRSFLGVAIGRTGLAGPRTGTSEPFGRGPVSGGPGRMVITIPMS